ncbi:3-hydroxyacyl-CoA dehydrogenase/enoyl-CoA hydratase family protein [Phnomibacter sp. MR]|uniref:3-hydroxyacyl-CoA dehydrogenase/enoyl-CoA hydratase family protein n=1 Tax=Phnomibacter sp. MR TaxID=3042318 RepID=UPI003A7FE1FF
MNRSIKKVAVLGSGVMGSRIACHFAGIGLPVLLLDMVPKEATESTKPAERNKLVNDALAAALKSNPSPVFTKAVAKRITTGNFTDNMKDIAQCDWVIEVVVERLDIKQIIYEQVEKYRKPGTLITSNTSGIPIYMLSQGRSEDFRKHFCGTHFFNPPRYLRLLEIIPTPDTDPAIVDFLMQYGDLYLGKTTVLCKDTPAFIANRIGVFSMMAIMRVMEQQGLSTDEIDALTGPAIGRPKSATFRTADVVGIDTLVKVAQGVAANCPTDEAKDIFTIPAWLEKMVAANMLGDKTKGGFFKMDKSGGKKEILTLNLQTLEYGPKVKPKFASIEAGKQIDDLKQRIKMLVAAPDKAGEFYRAFHHHLFSYISHRIPEISDELYRVDDAMMAGFGWEIGAFETWDLLGVAKTNEAMKAAGFSVAVWVDEFIAAGNKSFYKVENGKRYCYDVASKTYKLLPGGDNFIILSDLKEKTVWKNSACTLVDMGDDVLGLSWSTKMNTIGGDVLAGIQKSVAIAEEKYKGLVIANEGANFSLGANVGLIFMYAIDQEYDELDMAVRMFQNTSMRLRYSSVPVVVAPHGMALGGGCEFSLHADKIQAAAETYIGLVELGVGLIPGGGGTKEFALRAGDEYFDGEIEMEALKRRFFTIGMAKVATSAHEAFELGIMRKGIDEVSMNINRRVADAKRSVLEMYNEGYVTPMQRTDVKVLGRGALGAMLAGLNGMQLGNYITEHDVKIAKKLAYVMCGGDLSEAALVSEQYLLDIEREAFLSLTGEKKTLERIQSVLKGGKPVRN